MHERLKISDCHKFAIGMLFGSQTGTHDQAIAMINIDDQNINIATASSIMSTISAMEEPGITSMHNNDGIHH